MELAPFVFLLLAFASPAAAGVIGVDYGRDGNNLLPPPKVVDLLKSSGITAVSIFDTDADVLRAFANSGIRLTVSLPNKDLATAATNPGAAGSWVRENIAKFYPATRIEAIAVGNEVFQQRPDLSQHIVPAMWNVYNALKNLNLAAAIKVSSPLAFSAIGNPFPPSQGSFRSDLQPVIRQILDFLRQTDSFFMINIYPYFTYMQNLNIDLNYALGLPNNGVRDPRTGLTYYSLLDAQLDTVYSAMAALGIGAHHGNTTYTESLVAGDPRRVRIREIGHPTRPPRRRSAGVSAQESAVRERGPTVENAQAHNSILVNRILEGKTGTPLHPDYDLDIFIFSLFNENLKEGNEDERNFGLFYPDGTKVYEIDFRGHNRGSWCVADAAVGSQRMQEALDYACGRGAADCGPIQPGARCYEPNTLVAHASYAVNSYYQKNLRQAFACDFKGAGRVVYQRPRFGNCEF